MVLWKNNFKYSNSVISSRSHIHAINFCNWMNLILKNGQNFSNLKALSSAMIHLFIDLKKKRKEKNMGAPCKIRARSGRD